MIRKIPSPDKWSECIPDPFAGVAVKTSKYYGKKSHKGKLFTSKEIRSIEKFDRHYAPTSDEEDEEDDHKRYRELASFANYKTDNVHYNTVQELMRNRKKTKYYYTKE